VLDLCFYQTFSGDLTMPIRGVHTMFYSSDAAGTRAFLRDKLGLKATDIGEGWLIFDVPEADMGVHPSESHGHVVPSGEQSISFYCDNIETTVAELKQKGVEFTGPVENHGYGLVTFMKAPGNFTIQLYQPLYPK
jgi:catechol 2,3-dioxygenase-like lactoylglutathione lyase family enzyme